MRIGNKQTETAVDSKQKGDLIIRELWDRGTYCILDMRAVNRDANSYQLRTPEKLLAT